MRQSLYALQVPSEMHDLEEMAAAQEELNAVRKAGETGVWLPAFLGGVALR